MTTRTRGAPPFGGGRVRGGRRVPARRGARTFHKTDKVELKFHDVDVDDAVIATGAQVVVASLNIIAQGTTEVQRVGRRVVIKKIGLRYDVSIPSTSTQTSTFDVLRLMLVHDKQCNGVAADDLDILEDADHQSFNNLSNRKRFTVLMDRTHAMSIPAGSGRGTTDTLSYGAVVESYTFFKDVDITIEFDDTFTDGRISTQKSSNLLWLTAGRSGVGGVVGTMRLRFHD